MALLGNKPKKADILIILSTAVIGILLLVTFNLTLLQGRAETAVIEVGGKHWGEYLLNGIESEKQIDIETDNGLNRVCIGNGYAYMQTADCNDLLCVKTGKITKPGEIIVCLPNTVSVRLTGSPEVDVVSH